MGHRLIGADTGQPTAGAAAFAADESRQGRLARDLRARVMEPLVALRMDAAWMRAHLDERDALDSKLGEALDLLAGAFTTVRDVSDTLAPLALEHLGLAAALDGLLDQFRRRTGLPCEAQLDEGLAVEPAGGIVLYRIVQEWLDDLPAEAASVAVRLAAEAEDLVLTLQAEGASPLPKSKAPAARKVPQALRARVGLLHGSLSTQEGSSGASLVVRVPLRPAN